MAMGNLYIANDLPFRVPSPSLSTAANARRLIGGPWVVAQRAETKPNLEAGTTGRGPEIEFSYHYIVGGR